MVQLKFQSFPTNDAIRIQELQETLERHSFTVSVEVDATRGSYLLAERRFELDCHLAFTVANLLGSELPFDLVNAVEIVPCGVNVHLNHIKMYGRYHYADTGKRFNISTTPNGNGRWHMKLFVGQQVPEVAAEARAKFLGMAGPILEELSNFVLANEILAAAQRMKNGSNFGDANLIIQYARGIQNVLRGDNFPD